MVASTFARMAPAILGAVAGAAAAALIAGAPRTSPVPLRPAAIAPRSDAGANARAVTPRPSPPIRLAPTTAPVDRAAAPVDRAEERGHATRRAEERRVAWTSAHAAHEREPVDATWAPTMNHAIGDDLERLAASGGFAIDLVDCRSQTCAVQLSWSDRAAAMATLDLVVSGTAAEQCARGMTLPVAEAGAVGAYTATLQLDCAPS